MTLHPPVLILGDRPNPKKNLSMEVAFVGTASYRRLLDWIGRMDLDINQLTVANSRDLKGELDQNLCAKIHAKEWPKVITLGKDAAEVMYQISKQQIHPTPTFNLPHPSGLNRDTNDKKKLANILTRCRNFVYAE